MGKIKAEVSGFKSLLGGGGGGEGAPKSLTAINMCLDEMSEMEEYKGRDIASVSDWLKESSCGFVPQ